MGRYINWADVNGRYADMDRIGDAAEVGSTYIQYAESFVDARLAPRFTVPFSPAPQIIKDLAIDITYLRANLVKGIEKDVLRADVDERLKMLSNGQMSILTDSGTSAAVGVSRLGSNTKSYTPVFGMGDIQDMRVDPDRTDDEESAR